MSVGCSLPDPKHLDKPPKCEMMWQMMLAPKTAFWGSLGLAWAGLGHLGLPPAGGFLGDRGCLGQAGLVSAGLGHLLATSDYS